MQKYIIVGRGNRLLAPLLLLIKLLEMHGGEHINIVKVNDGLIHNNGGRDAICRQMLRRNCCNKELGSLKNNPSAPFFQEACSEMLRSETSICIIRG